MSFALRCSRCNVEDVTIATLMVTTIFPRYESPHYSDLASGGQDPFPLNFVPLLSSAIRKYPNLPKLTIEPTVQEKPSNEHQQDRELGMTQTFSTLNHQTRTCLKTKLQIFLYQNHLRTTTLQIFKILDKDNRKNNRKDNFLFHQNVDKLFQKYY